ncbi:hypothetical protein, partial [Salmonella sp. s51228]|uniref:hypothetical protein n=1 Tax=Salmonella sp. s51228 TaxID=3159652 RepID=UPI003980930B
LLEKQAELDFLKQLEDILSQSGTWEINPYTDLSYDIVYEKYSNLLNEGFPNREQSDLDEKASQEKHEELRIEFANIANRFAPWVQSKSLELTQLGLSITGSLEEHKNILQEL